MSTNTEYQIKTKKEMIEYIHKSGVRLKDFDYQLETNYALVYKLPNDEIILLPAGKVGMEYPSFLFSTKNDLEKMIDNDFFPINKEYMNAFELEYDRMKNIQNNLNYYYSYLSTTLKIDFDEHLTEIKLEKIYNKILLNNFIDKKIEETVLISYSILYMDFLRKIYNGNWEIKKKYGVYNPYVSIFLQTEKKRYDIYQKILIAIKGKKSSSFSVLKKSIELY